MVKAQHSGKGKNAISHLRKFRRITAFLLSIFCSATAIYAFALSIKKDRQKYTTIYYNGISQIESGNYQEGLQTLTYLGDFKDSLQYIEKAQDWMLFERAEVEFYKQDYESARNTFYNLQVKDGFDGAAQASAYITRIDSILAGEDPQKAEYDEAIQLYNDRKYEEALSRFNNLKDYEQSKELAEKCEIAIKILINSSTISAGTQFSTGVTKNGRVDACGYKPLKDEVENWTDIISISAFGSLVIGLRIDGTVVTAGELNEKYRIETGNWDDIIAVSAGDLYIVGLRNNGTLVAQGYSGDGQMDIDSWTDIVAIDTGWRHTVGLTKDGEVLIAGLRHDDEELIRKHPEEWHDIISISAGGGDPGKKGEQGHTVGLRSDGTVVAVGDNGHGQCDFSAWKNEKIVAIAAGGFHTVGLTEDGRVVTTENDEFTKRDISEWEEKGYKMVAIAAGYGTTFAIDTNGNVHSTGYYYQGQRDTDGWGQLATHEKEWKEIRPVIQ